LLLFNLDQNDDNLWKTAKTITFVIGSIVYWRRLSFIT
jgi:hypothetical protein